MPAWKYVEPCKQTEAHSQAPETQVIGKSKATMHSQAARRDRERPSARAARQARRRRKREQQQRMSSCFLQNQLGRRLLLKQSKSQVSQPEPRQPREQRHWRQQLAREQREQDEAAQQARRPWEQFAKTTIQPERPRLGFWQRQTLPWRPMPPNQPAHRQRQQQQQDPIQSRQRRQVSGQPCDSRSAAASEGTLCSTPLQE